MCSKTSVSCLATSNCRQRVQSECTLDKGQKCTKQRNK